MAAITKKSAKSKAFDREEVFNEVFSLKPEPKKAASTKKSASKPAKKPRGKAAAKKAKAVEPIEEAANQSADESFDAAINDERIQEIINDLIEMARSFDNTIDKKDIEERTIEVLSSPDDMSIIYKALKSTGIEITENEADDLDLDSPSENIAYDQGDKQSKEAKSEASQDAVRTYLREIGRIPLLTSEAELKIAQRIAAGKKAQERLDADLRVSNASPEKLTAGEKAALQAEVKDSEEARKSLAEANLRLVVSIAKKYTNRGMAFLDLIQEGNLGLLKAVDKYDYNKGFKFSTYATWWIRQAITRSIADQGRTIRIPVHMVETINKVKKAASELLNETGRDPSPEEIAKKTNLTVEKVKEALKSSQDPVSLETPIGEEEDSHLGDFIQDEDRLSPVDVADQSYQKQVIEEVLDTLAAREKMVIKYRFGLIDGNCMTLEEVGREFGVTRERIRQIEAKALRKLRHPSRSKKLKDLL